MGEVRVGQVEQGHLGLLGRNGEALLGQNAADALEADGEAHRGHLLADELADHVVVAAAACHRAAEGRAGDLEHHAGVVALAAHQAGAVGDLILAAGQSFHGGDHLAQVLGQALVLAQSADGLQAELTLRQEIAQGGNRLGGAFLLGQLFGHALGADLVQLVEGDAHAVQAFGGKAHAGQHAAQKAPVVDVHGEVVKADVQKGPGGHVDQLDLRVAGAVAQNVDVALDELPHPALLGPLGTEHPVGLDDLEGAGQLVLVGGVVAGEGQGQVVPQAHVGQILLVAGGDGRSQLVAPLEYLEDQVQVVAAVALVQVLHVLQHGGGDALEAAGAVGFQNTALHIVAQCLLGGQVVLHALQRIGFH